MSDDVFQVVAFAVSATGQMLADTFRTALGIGITLHEAWCNAARACGLTDVEDAGARATHLTGQAGSLRVRFERSGFVPRTRIRIADEQAPRVHSLSLRREDITTSFIKGAGFREIEIGDPRFDEDVFLEGPVSVARAVLDVETRRIARELVREGGVRRWYGSSSIKTIESVFEHGVLKVTLEASSLRVLDQRLPEILAHLVDAARRLTCPVDIAARLARTASAEPFHEARLQALITLAREFPEHAATRPALRAGLADVDEEIRLRCALALEGEGRAVLRALAVDPRTADSVAARAFAATRDQLSLDAMQEVLGEALRSRRLLLTSAAVEALGRRRAPEALPMIVRALKLERGAPALAAVRALALSGLPAAEAPLTEVLGRDRRDVSTAAAQALARVGSVAAVPFLKEAMKQADNRDLYRAARQAIAEIQSRVHGARPGQLTLAEEDAHKAGALTIAEDERGRVSLSEKPF